MVSDPISTATREGEKPFLNEKELASRWSISVKLLQKMRLNGGGPAFNKFGTRVRYPIDAIVAFEAHSRRTSTSDSGH